MENLLHIQQTFALFARQLDNRDLCPRGYDRGNILRADLVGAFLRALLPAVLCLFELFGDVLLLVTELCSALKVLLADGGGLFAFEGLELCFEILDLVRIGQGAQAHLGSRFVNQVDCLVGQIAVGDITRTEFYRSFDRFVGNLNLVVSFVTVAQTFEDGDRVLFARLSDLDGLEAAFEGGVLLDILAVLFEGRRADNLEVAARQRGLEDISRVGGAFCRAGADDGVQLVDEEDDVLALLDLFDRVLDTILEVAAILGTGDHTGEIKCDNALVTQVLGYFAVGYLQRQSFGDGRLADAGLADQTGVVFGAAGKDLDDALDLFISADHGVDLAVLCGFSQVARKAVEGLAVAVGSVLGIAGVLIAALFAALKPGAHMIGDGTGADAQRAEIADRVAVAVGQERNQQMLGADVAGAGTRRIHHGGLHDALGARGEVVGGQIGCSARALHH